MSLCNWLISLSVMSSGFIHIELVREFPCFLKMSNATLHVYAMFCFPIYCEVDILISVIFETSLGFCWELSEIRFEGCVWSCVSRR